MSKKFAFLFPGQGAQYVGMAKDFYETFPIAKEAFQEAEDLLKLDLTRLVFEGPADELTLTVHSQVAIYVSSIAILRTLLQQFPHLRPTVCAGLSLGEYTALTAAGKLSFENGLPLVQARAQYMNDACEAHPGTMQVILGMEAEPVEQVIRELAGSHAVWVANLNCPGQVVISGTKEGVQAAADLLKTRGAKRALPLDVSGAFHSGLMSDAQERLRPLIEAARFVDSSVELVMNVPGDYVASLGEVKRHLIAQVTHPVRWEKGIRAMAAKGIESYVEIGPGKSLTGMNKRIGIEAPTSSIEKIADLDTFAEEISYATIER